MPSKKVADVNPKDWKGLPKATWGPLGWTWLHMLAINFPTSPTEDEQRSTHLRIWRFLSALPCGDCIRHATMYYFQHPPDVTNSLSLQTWVWNFHNTVNRRLGKPILTYPEYMRIYFDEISQAQFKVQSYHHA